MSVRVIVRDHERGVLAFMCSSKLYKSNMTMAKALVAWIVVDFNKDLGLQHVHKGDALELVWAVD